MSQNPPAKTIALGVTGSIAAHKAIDIASDLTQKGHRVRVVMTKDAMRFVTPLPFKTLSRGPVITDLYDEEDHWKPSHIQLADEADAILIAPCSATTIARIAHGLADDALSAIALALSPKTLRIVAPAMNGHMWLNPITQSNIQILKNNQWHVIGPAEGMLSCGYQGIGRLCDFSTIVKETMGLLASA